MSDAAKEILESGHLESEGFPHNYLDDKLEATIRDIELSTTHDTDVPDDAIQTIESDRRISLVAAPNWDEVRIEGEVHVPEAVFNGTLPVEERDDPPVSLLVAVQVPKTILRYGVAKEDVDAELDGEGTYPFSVELSNDKVRGAVTLKPYLVRSEGQDDDPDYAGRFGDRLAADDAWTVQVDEESDSGGFLHPQIEPFDRSESFPGEENLHYLHFEDPTTPKLFLNANHSRLVHVLQHEGTWGGDARFRDVLFDYIEQSVWQELLLRAAADADPETAELRHPWQEEVVDLFTDELYDDADYEGVVQRLGRDAASKDDLDELVRQVDLAIQQRVEHPDAALKLLQEGLKDD